MTTPAIVERSRAVRYLGSRTFNRCQIRRVDPNEVATMIFPGASRKIRDHSPTGFEWGYGGSGPAQTALALCLDFTGDPEIAQMVYQDVKFEIVSKFGDSWDLSGFVLKEAIERSLAKRRASGTAD